MKQKFFIGAIILFLVSACKSEKEKLTMQIAQSERELRNDTTGIINFQKATEMVKLYEDFVARFPKDSMSANYLFKAADVAAHSHNITHSIELYKQLIEQYPQSEYVPQAWFLIGFLNENELKNIEEARKAYQVLLDKYPRYEQVQTVQWLLQNLGKTDAEIVRQFEAVQQQSDSAVVK